MIYLLCLENKFFSQEDWLSDFLGIFCKINLRFSLYIVRPLMHNLCMIKISGKSIIGNDKALVKWDLASFLVTWSSRGPGVWQPRMSRGWAGDSPRAGQLACRDFQRAEKCSQSFDGGYRLVRFLGWRVCWEQRPHRWLKRLRSRPHNSQRPTGLPAVLIGHEQGRPDYRLFHVGSNCS